VASRGMKQGGEGGNVTRKRPLIAWWGRMKTMPPASDGMTHVGAAAGKWRGGSGAWARLSG
jgi:hypothetical protein